MKLRKSKPYIYVNDAVRKMPRFLPGDPIVEVGDGISGRVEFARHDGQVCVVWDHSSRREWVHEDMLAWAPGFAPMRRR